MAITLDKERLILMSADHKKKIFIIDFDDTLVKSSECIIDMINRDYGTNKSIKDLKDWNYKSICREMTQEKVLELYEREEFFDNVKIQDGAQEFIERNSTEYKFVICTKGSPRNLDLKKKFCDDNFKGDIQFYGIEIEKDNPHLDKSILNCMNPAVCMDDHRDALNSLECPVKIIMTNGASYYWNKMEGNGETLYMVKDFKEAQQVLDYLYIE